MLTGDEEVDESVTSEYSIQSDNLEVQINENEADDCKYIEIISNCNVKVGTILVLYVGQ